MGENGLRWTAASRFLICFRLFVYAFCQLLCLPHGRTHVTPIEPNVARLVTFKRAYELVSVHSELGHFTL